MSFLKTVLASVLGSIAGVAGTAAIVWFVWIKPWWTGSIDEPMDLETLLAMTLGPDYIILWVSAVFIVLTGVVALYMIWYELHKR